MKLLGLIMLAGLMPVFTQAGVLTGNLLSNPGAETGDLTGWTVAGNTGAGVDSGTFDPGINPHSGSYDFYGGVGGGNPLGTLSQTVSIVSGGVTTSLIDAGTLSANVSFWEQSLNQGNPSDEGYVELTFLNSSNGIISTAETTSVYSIGAWENVTGSYLIPTGTRSIMYTMGFQLEEGTNIDSFIDDNVLDVSSPSAAAAPEPATLPMALGTAALGGFVYFRRRKQA